MQFQTYLEVSKEELESGYKKWSEAYKTQQQQFMGQLAEAHKWLLDGYRVIDLFQNMKGFGLRKDNNPQIAVAGLGWDSCVVHKSVNGSAAFCLSTTQRQYLNSTSRDYSQSAQNTFALPQYVSGQKEIIFPAGTFNWNVRRNIGSLAGRTMKEWIDEEIISTPTPIAPPHVYEKMQTLSMQSGDAYVAWQPENWVVEQRHTEPPPPPKDPFLLKRISANFFAVVTGWDLTEIERQFVVKQMV